MTESEAGCHQGTDVQTNIVAAFHRTARLMRAAIFDDDRLMPTSAPEDATIAASGWVGPDWKSGGTLLMGINPGGGGDRYRGNPTDQRLYGLLQQFRDADDVKEQRAALRRLSDAWMDIQSTHAIRRVTSAVLDAVGECDVTSAFMNVLPFRTREDKPARAGELRRAWTIATGPQVAALKPRRIVALGCKAHDALVAAGAAVDYEIVLIKRAIGDTSIPPHARETLARLKQERQQ